MMITPDQLTVLRSLVERSSWLASEMDQNRCVGKAERDEEWSAHDDLVTQAADAFGVPVVALQ